MTSRRHHAPDKSGRGSTANAIALVRALGVVVAHEAVEGPLQGHATGEVVPTEGHTPVLLENRALQPFDKAVGPGMARFGARVTNPELATRLIEGAFEFGPTIGQHAADLPAGPLIVRHHDVAQKRGRVGGEMSGQQPGQAVRRGCIAGRNLPDLADAFEVADSRRCPGTQARPALSPRRAGCGRSGRATGVGEYVPSAARPYAPPDARARSAERVGWPARPGAAAAAPCWAPGAPRSEEHTSELQSRELISYAVFCLKKKKKKHTIPHYSPLSKQPRQTTT